MIYVKLSKRLSNLIIKQGHSNIAYPLINLSFPMFGDENVISVRYDEIYWYGAYILIWITRNVYLKILCDWSMDHLIGSLMSL